MDSPENILSPETPEYLMENSSGMILIVDDRPENILPLKKILEMNGFRTDTAGSGEQTLKKVLRHNYSVIIMDVQMPDMDGFEVAETIAGYSKVKDIPILFLSAVNRDKKFIAQGYASGGIDYLTKPVDPDILILKVKTFYKLYEQKQQLKTIQAKLTREVEGRKRAQESLASMNETLEEKIHQRTSELMEMNRELRRANEDLEQFTWVVSHDLREPLRKIQTFNAIIRDRYLAENPEASGYLERSIRSAERLSSLIEDLLTYSRLSTRHTFVETDLNDVLSQVMRDLEPLISQKKAVIHTEGMPKAEVIPGQLYQAFQHLVDNALKFNKPDEPPMIDIRASIVREPDGTESYEQGDFCRIDVRDNGLGFDAKYLDRIFVIFQRLHEKTHFEGTGIGLAMVKKIMDNHKGTITATSREGEGSIFTLIFPLSQTKKTVHAPVA